jgi:hypothetical protein
MPARVAAFVQKAGRAQSKKCRNPSKASPERLVFEKKGLKFKAQSDADTWT